jgi:hypothetical protein
MSKFNPSDYYLIPTSIFEDTEMEKSFYDFLKTEVNTEPLEFLRQVNLYKNTEKEKLKELGEQILNEFIKVGAKKWINLDSEMKSFYESKFDEVNYTIDLFDKVEKRIKDELISDPYRRYP